LTKNVKDGALGYPTKGINKFTPVNLRLLYGNLVADFFFSCSAFNEFTRPSHSLCATAQPHTDQNDDHCYALPEYRSIGPPIGERLSRGKKPQQGRQGATHYPMPFCELRPLTQHVVVLT
jgi:hypothetical protein